VSGTPAPDREPHLRAALDPVTLRVEHDALAQRLARRTSIDDARKAIYAAFAGFLASGLAVKLAFDRWFSEHPSASKGPPVFFLVALAAALALLPLAVRWAVCSRRHMRREDALYARFRLLRDLLGFDR
jgi:hypothetical protein